MLCYFDGLYYLDSDVLRIVFYLELVYVNVIIGNYEFMGLDVYMKWIDVWILLVFCGDVCEEVIEEVMFKGGEIGVVEVWMMMFGCNYFDFLMIIWLEDGWCVLIKVFIYVEWENWFMFYVNIKVMGEGGFDGIGFLLEEKFCLIFGVIELL